MELLDEVFARGLEKHIDIDASGDSEIAITVYEGAYSKIIDKVNI